MTLSTHAYMPLDILYRLRPPSQRSDKDGNVTGETKKTFRTTKGFFTIADVVNNICVFEMIDRPKSKWFGGIDAHHIFFENMSRAWSRGVRETERIHHPLRVVIICDHT